MNRLRLSSVQAMRKSARATTARGSSRCVTGRNHCGSNQASATPPSRTARNQCFPSKAFMRILTRSAREGLQGAAALVSARSLAGASG